MGRESGATAACITRITHRVRLSRDSGLRQYIAHDLLEGRVANHASDEADGANAEHSATGPRLIARHIRAEAGVRSAGDHLEVRWRRPPVVGASRGDDYS